MEIWKPINGFKGFEVSNLGRVKSLAKTLKYSDRLVNRKERVLKPHKSKIGYYTVAPFQKTTYVHHLVALAFIGDRPAGLHIDHIDGNKLNNRVENLRYVSVRQNVFNGFRLGITPRGSKCNWSKLDEKKVEKIRKDNRSHSSIAKDYGVCRQTIGAIKSFNTWKPDEFFTLYDSIINH